MPIHVENAYTVLVVVAEEDYRFDVSGELSGTQMAQMMKDIYDPDPKDEQMARFVWMEKWLMSESDEGKNCVDPSVHEILNRSWRYIG